MRMLSRCSVEPSSIWLVCHRHRPKSDLLRTGHAVLHFNAWLARRWHDPAFPLAFPWFNSARYWSDYILELKELLSGLQEPPLAMPDF